MMILHSYAIIEIKPVYSRYSRDRSFLPNRSELETTARLEIDTTPAQPPWWVSTMPYAGHSTPAVQISMGLASCAIIQIDTSLVEGPQFPPQPERVGDDGQARD